MDLSDARSSDVEQNGGSSSRRKSGRAIRKPQLYSQDVSLNNNTAEKRKRMAANEDEENDDEEDAEGLESEDDPEDEDPDEEEEKERRKAARRAANKRRQSAKGNAKRTPSRATKKAKTNSAGKSLAIRSTTNGKAKKAAPKKRSAPPRPIFHATSEGLFGDLFEREKDVEAVVEEWVTEYEKDPVEGMRVLFNLFLQSTGADLSVDTADVTDEDHWPQRIQDLQEAHLDTEPSDYPLISRDRRFRNFRSTIVDFCDSWVENLHRSSLLYNSFAPGLKAETWLNIMSSSGNRAFRHTATLCSITIASALCDVAEEIATAVSTSRKQLESEKRKKQANKGRINTIENTIQENEEKLVVIEELLREAFDTMWVHRYRDVDFKIRSECYSGLARWIQTHREMFFEPQYVRYLGWGLSDSVTQVRFAVVAQLRLIYEIKFSIATLRTFTGRFLRRLVEMALRDTDTNVRTSTVELLGLIRNQGLMENAEIDQVGQLVFDAESRIRKVAGRFFAANLEEIYETHTEEMAEDINETFGDQEDEDDFEAPKRSWIKYKCLVDILQSYDGQRDDQTIERQRLGTVEALSGAPVESRFFLATEAIYQHLKELSQWQSLAGYLLYDHSQISESPPQDEVSNVRQFFALEEGQDIILLEVLVCAVKLRILEIARSDINKRGQKIKSLTDKIPELQEETAHHLTQIIPRLLNKFGAVPEAASAVLRLEHLVDLDKIQNLQKDTTSYTSLLNDINRQFLTHSDQDVLVEASVAFLHARSSDEMKEAMESKVQELWDDMIETLSTISQNRNVQAGSSVAKNVLVELSNTVTRIANLASIVDCTSVIETVPGTVGKKRKQSSEAPFNTLIHLVNRGLREEESDEELRGLETELIVNSIKTLLFYFMWKVQALSTAVKSRTAKYSTSYFETLAKSRDVFAATLTAVMQSRKILDDIRFSAVTTFLDLQTLFGTLRNIGMHVKGGPEKVDEDVLFQTQGLAQEVTPSTQDLISKFHDVAERSLAKKLKKEIRSSVEDDNGLLESAQDLKDLPSDDEEENDEQDEDAVEDESVATERLRLTILAEQRLCELTGKIVLAIIGRVIDNSGSQRGELKKKLLVNKSLLGHNYKEVVSFLEDRKARPDTSAKLRNKQDAAARLGTLRPDEPLELEDDPIEDDADAHPAAVEEDEDEDLRARGLVEEHIDDDNENTEKGGEEDDGSEREENGVAEDEAGEEENGDENEDEVMGD
ncbi:nuclear cohesin complex subunit (Psc3), putative [Talaromyces stipitatus ATCC 10500]|uniref:Nuclear cohesin complex subunit (Psc3), putative n=1 Tax=Talaromyces stipitatus (strain ATCC 10500 / CBS 375.48 / QM 6759 / NRRL 1006) TaxID=441959 RepID=B8MQ05_TALSN|nr:nuclear cohesin complex subunit (Psc3), putative [Talaromyces stipitatus ATCC 10500]EED12895.1 nuclear cohesin complex subunit (Psc3), putative [Talaromyces stipitatus ATCC 10500]